MDIVLLDAGDQQWTLTPELIGKIIGVETSPLDAEMCRRVIRVMKKLQDIQYTGCITFVYERGWVQREALKTGGIYIGPNINNTVPTEEVG